MTALADADVPAWWDALGMPGLYDVHVHFLPPPVMRKVRAQFDAAGPLIGRAVAVGATAVTTTSASSSCGRWAYAGSARCPTPTARASRRTSTGGLPSFAAAVPECLRSRPSTPRRGSTTYVRERVEAGTQVFKVHVQVGDFDLLDPLLDEAWAWSAARARRWSSTRAPGRSHRAHRPGTVARAAAAAPAAVRWSSPTWAHRSTPEFLAIAEDFERVHLDTTMAFTDFFEEMAPFPPGLLPRLAALRHKVLLGSDFPNIPYAYAHQLESLERLGLGEDWLRDVCWHNGMRLIG